jgi:hypothetical protein
LGCRLVRLENKGSAGQKGLDRPLVLNNESPPAGLALGQENFGLAEALDEALVLVQRPRVEDACVQRRRGTSAAAAEARAGAGGRAGGLRADQGPRGRTHRRSLIVASKSIIGGFAGPSEQRRRNPARASYSQERKGEMDRSTCLRGSLSAVGATRRPARREVGRPAGSALRPHPAPSRLANPLPRLSSYVGRFL